MKRRKFIKTGTLATLSSPLLFSSPGDAQPLNLQNNKNNPSIIYETLVKANDNKLAELLPKQEIREGAQGFGGLADDYGIYTAIGTANMIKVLASALVAPTSHYYQSALLSQPLTLATNFLVDIQYEDGTIDLHTTNFHSPPDTAFVLEHLCTAYEILKQRLPDLISESMKDLERFILKAGQALCIGGIHTPNHRWVVCMALARINALFPDQKYINRIDQWLAEKIDIDPDGQYTEKSTAIYSPLTDRCLITIARLLQREELFEPVRKNLEMTIYYVHADGEVVTEASRRQDRYQQGSMAPYYYPYRFMSLLDKNPQYAAMARWIEKTAENKLTCNLIYFIEDPLLMNKLPASDALPSDYLKEFSHSGLVRIRRGKVSATILSDNYTFYSFHKGSAALVGLRFASAFFGKGQFTSDQIERDSGGYLLTQLLEGPYYQPFPAELRADDGDWHKMDRSLRLKSEIQQLTSRVLIKEEDGKFTFFIDIQGTNNVPVAVEMGFRHGGVLSGVKKIEGIPDTFLFVNDWGEYAFQGQTIRFGSGLAVHSWTQLRGAAPKLNAMSVYLTGYTPFTTTLQIL